jgi:hypothetical protein
MKRPDSATRCTALVSSADRLLFWELISSMGTFKV